MKRIISSRLEDIEREEQEYEAKVAPLRQKADEQQMNYRRAALDVKERIEKTILDAIGDTTLEIEVRVEQGWGDDGEYQASIRANDRDHFDKNRALSWNYDAKLKKGQLEYESGSWSGLKVTTPEQLADLEESVRILKKLQTIPWGTILKTDPDELKYDKFIDRENASELHKLESQKPDFKQMKKVAQLDDLVGTDKIVYVDGLADDNYRNGYYNGYIQLVSQTAGSYNVRFFDEYYVRLASDENNESKDQYREILRRKLTDGYTSRKLKKNVLRAVDTPLDVVDLDFLF